MKEFNYNIKSTNTIKALGYIQDASAKIYSLNNLVTPIWTGTVNSIGKVVDTYGNSPYLSYGDYRVVIEKCDYDTEISNFRVPDTSLVNLTIGCSSAITAHEAAYNHSLIGQSGGGLPSGAIIMWHGLIANIPLGFVICDGTNGTPDMRSRFARGAPAGVEAGGTGGSDTHTLTVAEMPSHNHYTPVHDGNWQGNWNYGAALQNQRSVLPTGSAGGDQPHNNIPAYRQLIFIMKT